MTSIRAKALPNPLKGWQLTQAVVARLSADLAHIDQEHIEAMRSRTPEPAERENPYGPTRRPDFDEPI